MNDYLEKYFDTKKELSQYQVTMKFLERHIQDSINNDQKNIDLLRLQLLEIIDVGLKL